MTGENLVKPHADKGTMSSKPSRELVAMVDNVLLEVVLVAVGVELAAHEAASTQGGAKQWWRGSAWRKTVMLLPAKIGGVRGPM